MVDEDFRNHPVGGVKIIGANEFPNLVQVSTGFRGGESYRGLMNWRLSVSDGQWSSSRGK